MNILAVNLHSTYPNKRDWEALISFMEPDVQVKIRKFYKPEDQLRTLCGELLFRSYAMERWNLAPTELIRTVNDFGKPQLAHYPSYHYNISHSGDWVVAAFDTKVVGIDIEAIAPIELSIADRFFTASEVIMLRNQKDENQTPFFYKLWTLKESYIKAEGKGISIPLDSFSFQIHDHKVEMYLSGRQDTRWSFCQYHLDPGYALSVCGLSPVFPEKMELVSWNDLASTFKKAMS
ncbi:4'-phosphopantetheinyl transferase family protein [Paenibacillus sp. KN14-4R]|uniref:4'-phosphopantetheinyl transferase family protein n=1 Tax=Paenibacillus sp. KN14-4R TaxID=3445773 RepID=UPI003F9F82EB